MINQTEVYLGDVVQVKNNLRKPLSKMERQKRKGNIPYYGANGILDFINIPTYHGKHLLIAEDGSVLTKESKPVLQLVENDFCVSNHAHVLSCENDDDLNFIYYALKNTRISGFITGTVQPKLNKYNLLKIKIPFFKDHFVRAKIARFLQNLDKKIELNDKNNEILNKFLKLIFKNWFLKKQSASNNNKKKFEQIKLGDLIVRSKKKIGNTNAKVLAAINSGELIPSENYFSKRVYSEKINNYLKVDKFDFAYNPSRINIGSIGLNKEDIIGAVSPVYVVFKTKKNYHWFIEQFLRLKSTNLKIKQLSSGSVRQTLSYDDFSSISLTYSGEKKINEYNKIYELFRNQVTQNDEESKILISLQKILLPKLMTGELSVS